MSDVMKKSESKFIAIFFNVLLSSLHVYFQQKIGNITDMY